MSTDYRFDIMLALRAEAEQGQPSWDAEADRVAAREEEAKRMA